MANEKVKLQKLDNKGKETDHIGEYDAKVAEKMVNRKNAHWKYAEQTPAKSSSSSTKDSDTKK